MYNDYDSTFHALIEKDNSVVIHQRNLRFLFIEMYKIHSKISPAFICDLISESECKYQKKSHYKITGNTNGAISNLKIMMKIPQVHKVYTVIESYSHIGPKLWNTLPEVVKKSHTLESFKSKLKKLTITECPCSICTTYIEGIGYFDHITHTDT